MYSLYDVTGIFSFGNAFVCIIMLPIIYKAEDIIKAIFGLQSRNLLGAAAVGLMALNTVQKAAKSAAKGAEKLKKAQAAKSVGRANGNVGANATQTNPSTSNVANNNMATGNSGNANKDGKLKQKAKNAVKKVGDLAKGKVGNELAAKVMGMALGYGLTGDYDTAKAGKAAQKAVRGAALGAYGGVSLSGNIAHKNDDMLDAYERLKDNGYTDEQIYQLTEDILADDGKQLANDLEKEYAATIKAVKDTQVAISDKENSEAEAGAKEYVLEKIQKHILK